MNCKFFVFIEILFFLDDSEEEYWVVDKSNGGVGASGDDCVTTKYDGSKWKLRKNVHCDEWYFYFCVKEEEAGKKCFKIFVFIEECWMHLME